MNFRPIARNAIAVALTAILLCLNSGCTVKKVRKLDVSAVARPEMHHLVGITTKKGEEVKFDLPGAKVEQGVIKAKVNSADYSIAMQDVQRLWVEMQGVSASRSIGLAAAIVVGAAAALAIVLLIAIALKQSCPFVYSWDGTRYVFDAEPYGGAITRGLERDDYAELEHLREQDGLYRLLLTNEVDETQYTNLMELLVVDHASGSRAVTNEAGNIRAFTGIQPLAAARDREGNDLLPWLEATDRKIWEPDAVAGPGGNLRQEVILTFAKPAGVTHVNLLANAATGLWGSYMIKRMVELNGRDSYKYLASLDKDPAAVRYLHVLGEREGMYRLPVEVEEETGWVARGTLPPGGPLLAEDRAIPLDVSRAIGNQLRIRLRPAAGFWALNSFQIAHGKGEAPLVNSVAASSARTSEGKDVLAVLAAADNRYYPMPMMTDRAEVTFPAPPRKVGLDRTVFLHSRGWYQLHLRDNSAPDLSALNRLRSVPGAAVRFAADRFTEWQRGDGPLGRQR
ncbi:MAG: hypothetical protein EXQ52_00900 [Bryobacterales bacterium]|nr:hypothetical protein [Bryobacterales bacterium]